MSTLGRRSFSSQCSKIPYMFILCILVQCNAVWQKTDWHIQACKKERRHIPNIVTQDLSFFAWQIQTRNNIHSKYKVPVCTFQFLNWSDNISILKIRINANCCRRTAALLLWNLWADADGGVTTCNTYQGLQCTRIRSLHNCTRWRNSCKFW